MSSSEAPHAHDLLALGEVGLALTPATASPETTTERELSGGSDADAGRPSPSSQRRREQTLRLPLLLRLLAAAQPLSSAPAIPDLPPAEPISKEGTPTKTKPAEAASPPSSGRRRRERRGGGCSGEKFKSLGGIFDDAEDEQQRRESRGGVGGSGERSNSLGGIFDDAEEEQQPTPPQQPNPPGEESALVDEVVGRLEAVAASYPSAEGVDVLAAYLAPSACRRIGRLIPLKRRKMRNSDEEEGWDTEELTAVARAPLGPRGRKRKDRHGEEESPTGADSADEIEAEADENDDEGDGAEEEEEGDDEEEKREMEAKAAAGNRMLAEILPGGGGGSGRKKKKRKDAVDGADGNSFFVKASSAAEDSQESALGRTLGEIASLVVASLEPIVAETTIAAPGGGGAGEEPSSRGNGPDGASKTDGDDAAARAEGGGGGEGGRIGQNQDGATVALSVKSDSLLAEPGTGGSDQAALAGAMDLTASLTALMHHAPVLRHRHVANALCRASVPQCSDLIARMAANCPASTPCLLRGCIDAHRQAVVSSLDRQMNSSITSSAKAAIRAIASLSKREACHVAAALDQSKLLPDLILRVWLEHDPSAAAALILEHLSNAPPLSSSPREEGNASESGRGTDIREVSGESAPSTQQEQSRQFKGNRRRIKSKKSAASHSSSSGRWRGPGLSELLADDVSLSTEARKCLVSCITDIRRSSGDGPIRWGHATTVTRAYALLVYRVGIGSGSSAGSGSRFVEEAMKEIGALARELMPRRDEDDGGDIGGGSSSSATSVPSTSLGDNFRRVAICACVVTCSRFPPIGDAGQTFMSGPASTACGECLSILLLPSISRKSDVFASRVAGFIGSEDATELRRVLVSSIIGKVSPEVQRLHQIESEVNSFYNTCRWALPKLKLGNVAERGVSLDAISEDLMALVDSIRRSSMEDAELDSLLKELFQNRSICASIIGKEGISLLVVESVKMLRERKGPKIPLVLPLHVEALSKKVEHPLAEGESSDKVETKEEDGVCQFVLNSLYSLEFRETFPDSPFVVDPRELPLNEARSFLQDMIASQKGSVAELRALESRLSDFIWKHCLDITSEWRSEQIYSHKVTPGMVSDAIRTCLHGDSKTDHAAARAERFFLQARACNPLSAVDTAAACALLSSQHSPPPFFSCAALCRDPLVLLQCHVSTWKCKGLRRVTLFILQRLLDANECIVRETAQTQEVASQMLAARDAIVARCLLIAGSGGFVIDDKSKVDERPTHCPMTVSLIRSLVARRRGLVAAMVKQGLPEDAVDWLIDFVPESLADAQVLTTLLSERNFMTAPERLRAADAALRIAIAHGPRNEAEAQPLAYAALTVLVNSFFLVIGPIGVPVTVLHEDGGQDVTQICRKATFRMLNAMQNISGRRVGLRNEAGMALQKVAGMCKSESVMSGVAGAAAVRRKAMLKDIWDAVMRAINAMGAGVQI